MFSWSENFSPWQTLKSWRPYFLIFVLGFLIYSQTLFFNFTYLDDQELIINKVELLSNVKNFGLIFTNDVFFSVDKFYYRPLLNISFMMDAIFGSFLTPVFYLDNILLHILAAALIFYLLHRLLKRKLLAFFLSLIFLLHPMLVQAVAWIPGRNDSLLTVFVLIAFIAFLNFLEYPRLRSYIAYLFFFLAALLTKESAIGLPLLIIFYFLFVNRGALEKSDKFLLVVGSAGVTFIWFLMRYFSLGGEPSSTASVFGFFSNLPALFLYLGTLIFPFNLAVLPILLDSTVIYGVISLLIILAFLFLSQHKRNNYIIFGTLWFLIFLLPSFMNFSGVPYFNEHRLHLSFFGFLLVIAEIDFIKYLDFSKRAVKISAVTILLLLALISVWHSRSFSDRLTFWQAAVTKSPHLPLAQRNLGVMYYFAGNFAAATSADVKALELNTQEPMVHNNLGVMYMEKENWVLAEQEFRAELKINPNYDIALFNMGDLFVRRGQDASAIPWFQAALRANPNYYEAVDRLLILQKRLK